MSAKIAFNDGELEVYEVDSPLVSGSLKGARAKFSKALQRQALEEILDEVDPDSQGSKLYLGNWRKGEIEITGIARIMINRFWAEIEYKVLFPPKKGKDEPSPGTYRVIRWNVGVETGAAVLALTANMHVVLIREFRHAARSWVLQLPRGLKKPGESLVDAGLREANEEAGISTTDATKVHNLGNFDADNGIVMAKPTLLCVTDVTADESVVAQDVSESAIGVVVLPLERVFAMIKSGEIVDSFTIGALFKALLMGYISMP